MGDESPSTINPADFENWGPFYSYGNDSSTEIIVSWKSERYAVSDFIKYGLTEKCENEVKNDWIDTTQKHSYVLKDLKPNTKYFYKISRHGDLRKVYSFKTGHSPGDKSPFKFTITSDIHANPGNPINGIFDAMEQYSPDHEFSCIVGDSINDGFDRTHWNSYFHDVQKYQENKPQMNATGNHDTGNKAKYARYLSAWDHPYEDKKKGAYYLMEYGNAVFFFLDSCNAGGWSPTPGDDQYDWLEENLEEYAKKDKWIFLFLHHQIYSTGDFSVEDIMHQVYRPLLQEYQIDAVFYGHDHHYECFWCDRESDYGGTLTFVVGGGGTQKQIDHSIMGDRDGRTRYMWPGRILNVRKTGVPPETPNLIESEKHFRNDDLVKECQLLGVLESMYVEMSIDGDDLEIKSMGIHGEIYHHLRVKRAGAGRKFTDESELIIAGKK